VLAVGLELELEDVVVVVCGLPRVLVGKDLVG
jgi:hypothetical protein